MTSSYFIDKYTLEERICESTKVKLSHPTHICAIIEKSKNSTIKEIDKKKFLIPKTIKFIDVIYIIRKKINLSQSDAIYMFINDTIPSSNENIETIYNKYKNQDGFLYIKYDTESTFGIGDISPYDPLFQGPPVPFSYEVINV